MIIHRAFDTPNHATFSIPSIRELLRLHLTGREVIVDPFARNSNVGTITNDLNINTTAEYHRTASSFCEMLLDRDIVADAVLFDPPYSRRQMKEMYDNIGIGFTNAESQEFSNWGRVKDPLAKLCRIDGLAISFGWNSTGLGKRRGFTVEEILLVNHGSGHHDTIVTVERKTHEQLRLR